MNKENGYFCLQQGDSTDSLWMYYSGGKNISTICILGWYCFIQRVA